MRMPDIVVTKPRRGGRLSGAYPGWFYLPAAIIFGILFLLPTLVSFFFAVTRWRLTDWTFIGWDNFIQFFKEPFLIKGLFNTVAYAGITSGLKMVIGLALALMLSSRLVSRGYLRSIIFFPVLVSTVGIGLTFSVAMHPTAGLINATLAMVGITGPGWLTNPSLALYSVALVDVWKGVGLATVIFMAGLAAIPRDLYEAANIDGARRPQSFAYITLPMVKSATVTVILLSFIGGLRSFDLIWAMTKGGPGFSSDVLASVVYKQYQAGFYGLSTAGNVVLLLLVAALAFPLAWILNRGNSK